MSNDEPPSSKVGTGEGDDDPNLPADVRASIMNRYRRFARHMAACDNQAKAARLAGYSEVSAYNQGWRLMQIPAVLVMVEEEREARRQRLLVTEERIIEAYAAIAFGDARRIVKWDDNGEGEITRADDLTDDEAMMVQSVERIERTTESGTTVTVKIKREPRQPALDALAKIKGMMRERVEVDGAGELADEMAELRERRRARQRASEAAQPVDVEIIDGEIASGTGAVEAAPIEPERATAPTPIEPGIAGRFMSRTPREGDDGG